MARKTVVERALGAGPPGGRMENSGALEWPFRLLSRFPVLFRLHPWGRADLTDMRWLPVNEDIELPADSPVPLALLDRFIVEASHRVVFDGCGCRAAFGCAHYPIEIGCLLMGDSAVESPPSVSREVDAREAETHARRAVEAGLVPVVGKARVDNFIYGIKDRKRLLTVCFCCECCCITRFTRFSRPDDLDALFPRLDGVSVEVTDGCEGCGTCEDRCYIGAVTVSGGRAHISRACRACGRCAGACPNDAIRIRIDDPDFLKKAYDRIRSYTKHD